MSRWCSARRLGGALAAAVASLVVAVAAWAPTPVAADDDGLRFESHTVYRLDPAADVVQVTVAVSVTHERPDPPDGSFYYVDTLWLLVPSEATSLSATYGDGRQAAVNNEATGLPAWALANVGLSPILRYRQTQSFTLAYTLPNLPPRSDGLTRVNDAVATFAVVAHGDPGLASVEVILPTSYDNEIVGEAMDRRTEGEQVIYSATAIADPDTWGASVASRDERALVDQRVEASGRTIDVRAWPGDTDWSTFVTEQLEAGLPALEDLVGLPWPAPADDLDVIESVTPEAHGFGGWYDTNRNAIEIGDELDAHLMFHELSHLWFNGDLFSQRWILEGLAEEYGARVVAALGNPPPAPEVLGPDNPGALRLNAWSDTAVARDELTVQRERFAYNTAWSVIRGVSDEIGMEAMAEVLAAAAGDRIAYQGDPAAERFTGPTDWTWFIDLLEEVGGSTQAAPLFASTVLTPEQLPLLERRTAARAAYDQLEAAGDEWTPPLAVRRAMADWDFDGAAELIDVASIVLVARGHIAEAVEPLGLEVPDALESSYESNGGDLSGLARSAEHNLDAARHLASAHAAVSDERGVLETIGLWWSGVDAELDQAAQAFEGGDAAAAVERAKQAEQVVDDAADAGGTRVGGTAAAAVALFVGILLVRRSLRNRRRPPAAVADPSARSTTFPLEPVEAPQMSRPHDGEWPAPRPEQPVKPPP